MGSINECIKPKEKTEKIDKFDNAIIKAKSARDEVKKYIKRMENSRDKQKELAKEQLKNGNRDNAKLYLGRSKAFETQITVGQGQLSMLIEQIIQIDQAKSEIGAMKALEDGNKLLKSLQDQISIEKWEKVQEDMNEARDKKSELDEFFARNHISSEDVDEEVEREIEKLMNNSLNLPDVSKKPKKQIENQEENEEYNNIREKKAIHN